MCKYCRKKGKRESMLEDEQLVLKIKKERVLGFSIRAELEKCIISTNINYCPMCRTKTSRRWTKRKRKGGQIMTNKQEIEQFEDIFGNVPFENIKKIQKYIQENYVSKDEIEKALEKCCKCEDGSRDIKCKDCIKQYFERKSKE